MKINHKIYLSFLAALFIMLSSGCKDAINTYNSDTVTDLSQVNVGTSLIAEITSFQAETFDGDSIDDTSKPSNSYLPEGTVDYCSDAIITHTQSGKDYRLLRYGKRVYNDTIKVYEGTLAQSNTLIPYTVESDGKYTSIYFETLFKAPFTLELKEQDYFNENTADFRINAPTFSYVEITFCYCSSLIDDFDFDFENNKLFSDYELIQNEDNAVLKLFLREQGSFYGWLAEYDENDMLVFRFLEPTKVYSADNEYGYALHDATIVIDAGHGGDDPGAMNGRRKEASINLGLATKLKAELEAIGVDVIMTRTKDVSLNAYERTLAAYKSKADMVISVHRDSGSGSGFNAYYFNPFTSDAAKAITKATESYGIYKTVHKEDWHYFFLSRVSCCPSVLTENGFISNDDDLKNMLDNDFEINCAKAITAGIIDFYINSPLY